MKFSERSTSVWKATQPALERAPLRENLETEVCVIGAGIAGLSVGYELCRAGRKVVVLDDNAVGGGETAQTTAHLASAMDDTFSVLEKLHGRRGARLAYESHAAAIDRIEHIVSEEGIACDFVRLDGYLLLGDNDKPRTLEQEFAAAQRAGFQGVEHLSGAPLSGSEGVPCIRFPRQAQFHPLRYVNGLAEAIERHGGRIFTGTHAAKLEETGQKMVTTSTGVTVKADALVVATNSPVNDRVAIHTKQAPYRTYVTTFHVPEGAVHPALYWDTEDPYHYVRLQQTEEGKTLLIVGGEDHKTAHADDAPQRYRSLEAWTRKRFSMAGPVEHRWSGQVFEPFDGLAFIGRNPGTRADVFIATGDSGQGMTHGVIAGLLIRDLIVEGQSAWESLYNPSRMTFKAIGSYAQINAAVAGSYTDWFKKGTVASLREVPAGSGAVLHRGTQRLAVYRADDGTVSACSAVCTHLGGVVRWNSAERSWDCPCHGSRFSPSGEVLNGPALRPLKPMQIEEESPTPEPPQPRTSA